MAPQQNVSPAVAGHEPVPLIAEVDWTPVGGHLPHATLVGRTITVTAHAGWRAGNGAVYLLLSVDDGVTMYLRRPGWTDFAWSYRACGLRDRALAIAPGSTARVGNVRLTRLAAGELAALSPIAVTRNSR